MWSAPNPDDQTPGGAAVRQLVLPQLFSAGADGHWQPSLVAPGSDREAADKLSASFQLRAGATWSDGTPITADDLRRTADARFVAGVDGPAADGRITVRFAAALANWRRLWSFTDSIAPPAAGVWGGPFVVASMTPGLETVLARNEKWCGPHLSFLDEVRLVLVPDTTMQRQLLDTRQVDVVMPLAATVRTAALERVAGVTVKSTTSGGWYEAVIANPARMKDAARQALMGSVDRAAFVKTLLVDEALPLNGFAAPEDATWAGAGVGDVGGLRGLTAQLSVMVEDPMVGLLHRSMQKRVRAVSGVLELRAAETDRLAGWVRGSEFDAAIVTDVDPPGGPCWRCRWESVDAALAAAADGGDRAAASQLEAALRAQSRVLPLWHPKTVVAWRSDTGLHGPVANGWALSAAWNAVDWWRDA